MRNQWIAAALLAAAACSDAVEPTTPLAPGGAGEAALSTQATVTGSVLNPANGHYYAAVAVPGGVTFEEAKKLAMNTQHSTCGWGYLAAVTSKGENEFIMKNLTQAIRPTAGFRSSYGYWLGARKVSGKWTWLSKEVWGYFPKAPVSWGSQPTISYWARTATQSSQGLWAPMWAKYRMPGYVVEWEKCAPASVPYGFAPGDEYEADDEAPAEGEEEPAAEETPSTTSTDATPPTITAAVQGTQGSNGWYTSDVKVSWTVTDAESKILVSEGCDAVSVTADTKGVTFTCNATSEGGAGSESVTIKRDASAPAVSGTPSGTLGANGWYTSALALAWSRTDDISGVASSTGCVVSAQTDTSGATATCTAVNGAGLQGNGAVTYKLDSRAPVVAFKGALPSYGVDQTVAITCSATDALSGIAQKECTDINGAASSFTIGENRFQAHATDQAGNRSTAEVTFTVSVTSNSLIALVRRYVTDKGLANSLVAKIQAAAKAKSADKARQLEAFRKEVGAQSGKKIQAAHAAELVRLSRHL